MLTVWDRFAVKKPKLTVLPYKHHPKYKFVLDLRAFGSGRKFFKTRVEAEAERMRQKTLRERNAQNLVGASRDVLSDINESIRKLATYEKTIPEAVAFYIDHLERIRRCKVTFKELAEEVVEAKRRDGMSKLYLTDLRKRLGRFTGDFGDRPIAGITVEEIDDWLRALPLAPKSRANYRANLGVVFSYASRRRILDFNPVLHTAKPKLLDNPPEIFKVDELRELLEAANRTMPDALPMLAIGAFAGLRDAEIKRLDWSEVDLVRGYIEVKAQKAKSARRRIVPIQPNLSAWLRPYSSRQGCVAPSGNRKKLDRVRTAARLAKWPRNGLRHSYASYRLAAIHDAPRVASELGHTSPAMLYNTYREVVRPDEAELFWQITPATEAVNVVEFANEAQA
jgi:integrase